MVCESMPSATCMKFLSEMAKFTPAENASNTPNSFKIVGDIEGVACAKSYKGCHLMLYEIDPEVGGPSRNQRCPLECRFPRYPGSLFVSRGFEKPWDFCLAWVL